MKTETQKIQLIRKLLGVFIFLLVLSGITAFPLETELKYLNSVSANFPKDLALWIDQVYKAIADTNKQYPFMAYGTDWLAFAHLVIAVVFIGPFIDPVKNIWVIQFGMIACIMVFPLAFIAGNFRGIPFYWQLIDCSFGIFGIIPLAICYKMTKSLEQQKQ